jgi:DNA-binding MurR/RpiR family transcriptional regulator
MIGTAVGSDVTLLETITSRRDQLRPSERKVADFILGDPARAMQFNMAGLANTVGVSEPTVMRFCSAIGFDGFRSFKIALAQTIALGLPITRSAISQEDSPEDLCAKIFSHSISSLDLARRRLDVNAIERAIDLITQADELIFAGLGTSGVIAQDAQQKFPLFSIPCQAPADVQQQFIAASMSSPRTVIVAISQTGKTREIIRMAQAALDAGGKVIALTGGEGPLSELADVEIRCSTFNDTDHYAPTAIRLAGLVIIDILATGVALRRDSKHLERVRQLAVAADEDARLDSLADQPLIGQPGTRIGAPGTTFPVEDDLIEVKAVRVPSRADADAAPDQDRGHQAEEPDHLAIGDLP